MAAFTKIADFVEAIAEGEHDLESDALTLALSNTAPASETSNPTSTGNGALANGTEVSYTNCSSRVLAGVTSVEASGTYKLDATDHTLTASGGSVGPFRYVYLYNDTPTTPVADPLIGIWDYGSSITLADTEELAITFNASNGILTIT